MARCCVRMLAGWGALALTILLAIGLLHGRLAQGPLVIEGAAPRIADALNSRFGRQYRFRIGSVQLELGAEGLALALGDMAVSDARGRAILSAPSARMSFDPIALFVSQTAPRFLEVAGVDVHVRMRQDGALDIAADAAPSPEPEPAPPISLDRVSHALIQAFDAVSGPESPLNSVQRLGIVKARLIVEDVSYDAVTFDGVDLSLNRKDGGVAASLVADGPNGRWRADAALAAAAGARRFELKISDLSFDEIALAAGVRQPGFVLDSPVSARLDVALDEAGAISDARAHLVLGSGLFKSDKRDAEPVLIDEMSLKLRYDPATRHILADHILLDAGETHVEAAGIVLPPLAEGGDWSASLSTRPGSGLGAERPNEKVIAIGTGEAQLRFQPANKALVIDRVAIAGPDLNFEVSGQLDGGEAPHMALVVGAKDMPLVNLLRIWPSDVAAPVRAWFLQHVLGGRLETFAAAMDFDADTMRKLDNEQPAPEDAVHMSGRVSNAAIWFLPGLPPVTQLDGSGDLSGRKASFDITRGAIDASPGRRMSVGEARFVIPDTAVKPVPANVTARLSGSLDTLSDLLAADSLKSFGGLPIDPALAKGQVDGVLAVDLKLGRPPGSPDDAQIKVNASVTNFVAEKLIGKERLENATLSVAADRNGLRASGNGRMFGAPATIEIKKTPSDAGNAVIAISLDEAARKQHNLALPGVGGVISARIEAPLSPGGVTSADVELDLAKATIDSAALGVGKPAGRPGAATFQVSTGPKGSVVDNIQAEIGALTLRGSASFGADGGFQTAKLSQLRLAPGDDMRLDLSRAGDGLKIVAKGNVFDARPMLASLTHPSSEPGAKEGPDLDIDFKAGKILGFNKQNLGNGEFKLSRKAGALRQFQLGGALSGRELSGDLSGPNTVNLRSANAGALLAFLDLYKRMEGGDMDLSARFGEGRTEGQVLIHDFALRDEPALRRIVSDGAPSRDEAAGTGATAFDASRVEFNKLQAGFATAGSRVEIRDGVMYGPQVGTSLEGAFDFAKNYVDVKGTFVPAYGLNNIFARIPLFGPLLGGGAHEGLFAVNFRISGPASGPTLNINPLSAIAPGFLRKIFGAGEIPSGFQPNVRTQ